MNYILITNAIKLAKYAQDCDVDRIMVDLEIIGKKERQGHLNTVISEHSLEDVPKIRKVLNKSDLLVRVNPIHANSKKEVDDVINFGADIVMLPMFTSVSEIEQFVSYVNGRAITNLLLETPAALVRIDDIVEIPGINEIHIGLNDLHLGMGLAFMFELLSGGIVEYLSEKISSAGIKFGFGGIARLGQGKLDSSLILSEHHRLKSTMVILSRDFQANSKNYEELRASVDLKYELGRIKDYLDDLSCLSDKELIENKNMLKEKITQIVYKK